MRLGLVVAYAKSGGMAAVLLVMVGDSRSNRHGGGIESAPALCATSRLILSAQASGILFVAVAMVAAISFDSLPSFVI